MEIQGIKFTSRSFQIDIDLKQVMVVDKTPIFDSCLIKTNKPKSLDQSTSSNTLSNTSSNTSSIIVNNALPEGIENFVLDKEIDVQETLVVDNKDEKEEVTLDVEELAIDDIKEVNLDVNLDDLDSITLKKPNEVYFELYREARNKAKQAKRSAIIAYLEAKNIKKTYMLDNLNDSDSEFDAEIDEASESELDSL